ncbi:MAG: peptidylprolyl isomerase, partial [Betaproteobacteria bacterium]|nr:peptidylprolyl isomerase [Betaproteobacteria bacterium]
MNKLLQSLILAGLATLTLPAFAVDDAMTAAPAAKQETKPTDSGPIATVNGVAIPHLYADVARGDLTRTGRNPTDENVLEVLISTELLSQEAVKLGLDKPEPVQALLDLQRKDTLGKVLLENYAKNHAVPEDKVKAEYDKFKAKMGDTEYHSRHILVDNEKLAKEIITKLGGKKPAKFEDLAKKYSKDPGSTAKGGDLGWMAPANLVPEFSAAMTGLKKGETIKTPVKTQFGWHVIQLQDSRKLAFPPFDQLKDRIA